MSGGGYVFADGGIEAIKRVDEQADHKDNSHRADKIKTMTWRKRSYIGARLHPEPQPKQNKTVKELRERGMAFQTHQRESKEM